jgi:branched-chain amino acid transport system substrate-binding protein
MVLACCYCHHFSVGCLGHQKEKSTTEPTASVTQTDTQAKDQTTQLSDQNAQYFPLQSYRVGPYAAGGTGFFGGFIDYLKAVNARGVNGVKLVWSECETEYVVEKVSSAMSVLRKD